MPRSRCPLWLALSLAAACGKDPTPPPPAPPPVPPPALSEARLTALAHSRGALTQDPLAELNRRSAITWRHGELTLRPLTGTAVLVEVDLRVSLGDGDLALMRSWGPRLTGSAAFAWDEHFGLGPGSDRCGEARCDAEGRVIAWREQDLVVTVRWEGGHPRALLGRSPMTTAGETLVELGYDARGLVTVSRPGSTQPPTRYIRDEVGRLASVTALGQTTRYGYDGELLVELERGGETTKLTWDERDRVTRVSGPGPLVTTLSYPEPGVTLVTDALGAVTRLTWRASRESAEVEATPATSPERATRWRFSSEGRLLAFTENGRTTTFTWAGTGPTSQLATVTYPGGLVQRLERDDAARLVAVDEGARRVGFTLDAAGQLTRLTTPDGDENWTWAEASGAKNSAAGVLATERGGRLTRYVRDTLGRPLSVESDGARDLVSYDPDTGRIATSTDERGATHTMSWDPLGRPLTHRRPDGATASWRYTGNGRLEAETSYDGQTTRYRYEGQTTHIEGPRGPMTRTHDALGRLVSEVSPLGTTRLTWRGPDLVEIGLPDGRRITRDHDAHGRLVREATSDGGLQTFTWEPPERGGRLLAETLPDGRTRRYTWDEASRLTHLVEAGPSPHDHRDLRVEHHPGALSLSDSVTGQTWLYRLDDGVTRLVSATAPGGAAETLTYDPRGRLIAKDSTATGSSKLVWDTLDRPASTTSAAAGETTFTFDRASRLTETGDGARTLRYTWDTASRLTSSSDGEHLWRLDYTAPALGLGPTALIDPAGRATRFTWDTFGRLATRTEIWGATTRYGYDESGRLSEATNPDGRTVYGWDERGRLIRLATNGVGLRALSWDELGRVVRDTTQELTSHYVYDGLTVRRTQVHKRDAVPVETSRTRDTAGRTRSLAIDGQTMASYRYDELGRLERVEGPAGLALDIERDPVGRRKGLRLAGGGHVAYRFDDARRLIGIEVRDISGALTTATLTWDGTGRLSSMALGGVTLRYRYAPTGRLAATEVDGPERRTEDYTTTPSGELTRLGDLQIANDAFGRPTLAGRTYDTVGRLVSANGLTLGYTAGRLATVARHDGAGATVSYTYDGDGRLIERVGTTHERWVFEGDELVLSRVGDAARGLVETRHIPGERPGERLAYVTAAGPRYLVQGPDGSTLMVLDGAGRVLSTHLFTAYGRPALARGDAPEPFAYRGRFRDPMTGLVHYPHRWYDPATGAFTAPDPEAGDAMEPASLPRYAYLALDPVNHVDPDGAQAHEWGPETCLKAVCKLFQSDTLKPVWSVGDGYSYLGAIEKRGWVYDVWARPVPGTDRVVTVFRDLNERASGQYGGGASLFDNIVLDPDGPRNLRLPGSARPATAAAPTTSAVTTTAPQAANQPGLLSRAGSALREGANNAKLGVQLYGRDVATTLAGLGGLSGTLGTSVGTIAVLPGGGLIIGAAVAVAGALGYGVGTAVNHIPGVPAAAQSFISSLMGYQQDQTIANLDAEGRSEGKRARAKREAKIRDSLDRDNRDKDPQPDDPNVAGGTVPLDGPKPGEDDEGEANTDEGGTDQDEANTDEAEPPAEPTILDKVAAKKITVTFTHSVDASSNGIANTVECNETLTFWNVGGLAPGYGEAVLRGRCVASLNGSSHESGGSGTFTGGPNGTIIFSDGEGSVSVKVVDGKQLELPDIGTRPLPAGAFTDWPPDLW